MVSISENGRRNRAPEYKVLTCDNSTLANLRQLPTILPLYAKTLSHREAVIPKTLRPPSF